eukprot:g752.t1
MGAAASTNFEANAVASSFAEQLLAFTYIVEESLRNAYPDIYSVYDFGRVISDCDADAGAGSPKASTESKTVHRKMRMSSTGFGLSSTEESGGSDDESGALETKQSFDSKFFGNRIRRGERKRLNLKLAGPSHALVRPFSVVVNGETVVMTRGVNCQNEAGWTPLMACCHSIKTVKAALSIISEIRATHGDLNLRTVRGPGTYSAGWTALHIAAAYDLEEVVVSLVEAEAKRDTRCAAGWSPLMEAVHRRFIGVARALLRDKESTLANSSTPIDLSAEIPPKRLCATPAHDVLAMASRNGQESMVELLLNHGANIDSKSRLGWTALHEACHANQFAVVETLLRHGADVGVRSKSGIRPEQLTTDSRVLNALREGRGACPEDEEAANRAEAALLIEKEEKRRKESERKFLQSVNHSSENESESEDEDSHDDGEESKLNGSSGGGFLGDLPSFDFDKRSERNRRKLKKNKKKKKERKKKMKKMKKRANQLREKNKDVPSEFLCELTGQIMKDPVRSPTGRRYERKAILKWITKFGSKCPLDGLPLSQSELLAYPELKKKIVAYKIANALKVKAELKEGRTAPASSPVRGDSGMTLSIEDRKGIAMRKTDRKSGQKSPRKGMGKKFVRNGKGFKCCGEEEGVIKKEEEVEIEATLNVKDMFSNFSTNDIYDFE